MIVLTGYATQGTEALDVEGFFPWTKFGQEEHVLQELYLHALCMSNGWIITDTVNPHSQ